MTSQIRVGVCGFCRPQAEVFERFKLLEVQQSFYWPPQIKTVERWRREAAEPFEFTIKAFQAITHSATSPTYRRAKLTSAQLAECGHFRDTPTVRQAWHTSYSLATALDASFIVFQCPPGFAATEESIAQLRRFFRWIKRGRLKLAWEPRHDTWTDDLIRELCAELDLVHVVDPLERESVWGSPRYFRLHGHALGNYRYNYNRPYTDNDLETILEHCLPGPTYCLFNNMQMAADALRFSNLVQRRLGPAS